LVLWLAKSTQRSERGWDRAARDQVLFCAAATSDASGIRALAGRSRRICSCFATEVNHMKATPADAARIASEKLAQRPTRRQTTPPAPRSLTEEVVQPFNAHRDELERFLADHTRALEDARMEVRRLEQLAAEAKRQAKQARDERDAAHLQHFPAVLRCDGEGCGSVIAFKPAIEDEVTVLQVARAARWTVTEKRHLCPGCASGEVAP
jgi:hypothetical protein